MASGINLLPSTGGKLRSVTDSSSCMWDQIRLILYPKKGADMLNVDGVTEMWG
jgi:hypothetical protein